jgi:N6-adenosine-specific RNA methylase IME4
VLSLNLHRRHLDESQRAMVAARLANLKDGQRTASIEAAASQGRVAKLLNVSRSGVQRAREVIDKGAPELIQAVDRGDIAVSVAAGLATASEAIQRQAVAEPERAHLLVKQAARETRESQLAAKQLALPAKRFGVIYADPPWRFEPWSRETGMDRAADNHYPTMTLEEIADLDIASIAADDCVLFLWATGAMDPRAHEVMRAWGFDYRSQFVWVKDRAGTGYWNRNQHELLLIGVRGDIPAPAPGTQFASVIAAAVGEHSEKPTCFHELIEAYFPTVPKIELNARKARKGWARWGFEAPSE